jgi:hypothetical protein
VISFPFGIISSGGGAPWVCLYILRSHCPCFSPLQYIVMNPWQTKLLEVQYFFINPQLVRFGQSTMFTPFGVWATGEIRHKNNSVFLI